MSHGIIDVVEKVDRIITFVNVEESWFGKYFIKYLKVLRIDEFIDHFIQLSFSAILQFQLLWRAYR